MRSSIWTFLAFTSCTFAQGNLGSLIQSQPDLSTLLSLVQLTGLNSTLSRSTNITILAPTNQAFENLPTDIPEGIAVQNRNSTTVAALLSNHVFQGYYPVSEIGDVPTFAQTLVNSSFFNDIQSFSGFTSGQYNGLIRNGEDVDVLSGELTVSRVTEADIMLGDGIIIHKIDTVLSFGPALLTYLPRAGLRGASGAFSSVDTGLNLGNAGDSNTGADVTDLTFFIPNDLAFEKIASVLSTANESTLREVLRYHVVEDNVIFSPSWSNRSVETVQGGELQLTLGEDEAGEEVVWVSGAKVAFPNVIVFNGVVHIIDQVRNPLSPPPSRTALDAAAPVAARVQFPDATSSSSLPFTSFSFGTELSNPYTTAPLLTTYQPVAEPTGMASTSTALVVYTGGASVRYAVDVLKVVVAVAAGVVVLGGGL